MKPFLFEQPTDKLNPQYLSNTIDPNTGLSVKNLNLSYPTVDNTSVNMGANKAGVSRNYKVGNEEKTEHIKILKKGFSVGLDIDVIISVIAAILEGFPGLGQLASAGINIIHAISYFIRGLLSSDDIEMMNSYFQGLVQFCMSFVPLAGDFISLGLAQFMKKMIAKTDTELIDFLNNTFPFLNIKRGIRLKKKGGMTYLLWAAIKQFGLDRLLDIVTFEKVKKFCIDLIKWLNNKFSNILGISQITNSLNTVIKIIDDLITISRGKPILGLN
jgi:hypothetical protein